jgi:alpha-tubulin suppressor-like RCC1 family protein
MEEQASTLPTPVPELDAAVDVATGFSHACAIRSGGDVWCWGAQAAQHYQQIPQRVEGVQRALALAAGTHTCALLEGGRVTCWGNNGNFQLGVATVPRPEEPLLVPGVQHVVELAVGPYHSCARQRDGSIWCWGGQDLIAPASRIAEVSNASRLFASYDGGCAIVPGGVRCWAADLIAHDRAVP